MAEAKAKENANVIDEQKINEAIAAGVAAKLAELAIEKVVEEKPVEEPAQEVEAKLDTTKIFDELKAEIYSYADADDLGFGLEAALPACAMKVVDDTVELEVNLELADCAKKGYKVAEGEKLPVKFVVASEDDVDEAEELIAETMLVNGLKKAQKAVVTASEEATRKEGFEYG